MQHELTSPHIPEQNGSAERENRTLVECVRTMLHAKNLSLNLWTKAVQTAAYLLNRIGSRTRGNKTRYELWMRRVPKVEHLRIFGCVAYTHVPKVNWRKLDSKGEKAIFVGYCSDTKGYRLWDVKRRKMLVSRDVIFDEFSIPGQPSPALFSGLFSCETVPTPLGCGNNAVAPAAPLATIDQQILENVNPSSTSDDESKPQLPPAQSPPAIRPWSPRPTGVRGAPSHFKDFYIPHTFAGIASSTHVLNDPESYAEAMRSLEAAKWKTAIQEEYDSLMKNGMWRLGRLPLGRKPVKCKWIYRIKTN
jgi:hypothetical protein